ncbi:hypothetical protein [Flavobacterium soli]|uniref:hypothetical protein n=1 Tax=Flavobacterium soli TaxID=344881 RepID=UPI00041B62AE|nr:hypothetical protein [Flavobacterium soli]
MKKSIIGSLIFFATLISCKNDPKEEVVVPTVQEEMEIEEEAVKECYAVALKQDTISLTISVKDSSLESGELQYNFFEKDKNQGTLVGNFKGDTLFADYTFMSEGKSSVREVVFLKKGNIFIEGYGDVEEKDGKTVFKDKKKLFFDSKIVLSKVDCK